MKEYSGTLLILVLKGARPERYRDNLRLEGAFQLYLSGIAERLREGRNRIARMNPAEEQAKASGNAENEA